LVNLIKKQKQTAFGGKNRREVQFCT